jgi:hypothetical protein
MLLLVYAEMVFWWRMLEDMKKTEQQLFKLRARQRELQTQASALEARKRTEDRRLDARRKIVVGGAVLAHAGHDPEWAALLREVLRKAVTRDLDKAVIGDLLGEPAAAMSDRPPAPAIPDQPPTPAMPNRPPAPPARPGPRTGGPR